VERFSRGCRWLTFLLKRGRSVAFANPALTALQARHVWLPATDAPSFSALANPAEDLAIEDRNIFSPPSAKLEHILVDARGRQHVVLRANGTAVQLMVEGADVAVGPVTITFLVRGLGAIREASDRLATLRRILSTTFRMPELPRWTATTRKLRNALVALDGRAAGASYREIAIVLYGIDYVELNWRTGLKDRMRHHLSRGQALAGGGYRDLLR
jgi:hypothetical protein